MSNFFDDHTEEIMLNLPSPMKIIEKENRNRKGTGKKQGDRYCFMMNRSG